MKASGLRTPPAASSRREFTLGMYLLFDGGDAAPGTSPSYVAREMRTWALSTPSTVSHTKFWSPANTGVCGSSTKFT